MSRPVFSAKYNAAGSRPTLLEVGVVAQINVVLSFVYGFLFHGFDFFL